MTRIMGKERRRSPRVKKRLLVLFRTSLEERYQVALASDFGPMGMFLVTPYLQDVGEHLWLQAEIAGGRKIQLHGKVQWKRCVPARLQALSKPGFGIQLLYAPEEWYLFLLKALSGSSTAKS
jgi:hypothetical protein